MAIKFRKKLLLAKIQPTTQVDAVPTGALNAIQTMNLTITPLNGEQVSRNLDRPTLGNDLSIHVGTHVLCEFEVEYVGSGVAGTAPPTGVLKRMCAMAETISVGDVQYDPVSSGEEMGTFYLNFDGQQHKMLDCRGSEITKISSKGIPMSMYKFAALWVDPASVPDETPDFTAFNTPLAVSASNTPIFTLHGYAGNMIEFSFDQSNEVVYRDVVGEESVQIVDRAPKATITIEAPPLSVKNFFTIAKSNAVGALQIEHGTVAGFTNGFDAATVQVLNPQYGEVDKIRTLNMDLVMIPSSSGDDDFKHTFK